VQRFWIVVLALVLANASVAAYDLWYPKHKGTVYVLTPMIDIIPEGSPIDGAEKEHLLSELRHQSEARDMQKAYAYLGSTLSLHDLLRGIEAIEASTTPLSEQQRSSVIHKLKQSQENHRELQTVQRELITLERSILHDIRQLKGGGQ